MLLLALVYLGFFVMLPSIPGLQVFAYITILVWPIFIVIAMRLYRNIEFKKPENLSTIMKLMQPNIRLLLMLGLINLFYFILISMLLSADIQTMAAILNKQAQLSEQELTAAMQTMMPIFFKLVLLFIPLMMISWFSPMLVAFNRYSLGKAIKSSIAGCLQYIVALVAAWLLLSAGMMTLMMAASVLVGLFAVMSPAIAQSAISFIVFGCILLSIALTLAFQYTSYRDIFRAA